VSAGFVICKGWLIREEKKNAESAVGFATAAPTEASTSHLPV